MKHLYIALTRYGTDLLQKGLCLDQAPPPDGQAALRARETPKDESTEERLALARRLVGERPDMRAEVIAAGLRSPFCGIWYGESGDKSLPSFTLPLKPLDLDLETRLDSSASPEARRSKAAAIWENFRSDLARLRMPEGAEKAAFETFFAILRKYGWYVRGTTGHSDISVFEQFKAVTGLASCLPDTSTKEVLLAAGDIPGIQRILYTITSKGAAKSLRGRSFHLQMLNEVMVRTILRDLGLPSACVITNAGGNFRLLARKEHESTLAGLEQEMNRRLLHFHKGEVTLALTWMSVPADRLVNSSSFTETMDLLAGHLQKAKRRPFASVAKEAPGALFGVRGTGSIDRCEVCHEETRHKRSRSHGGPAEGEAADGQRPALCLQCESFETMARQIARTCEKRWLAIEEDARPLADIPIPPRPNDEPAPLADILRAFGTTLTLGRAPTEMTKTAAHFQRLNETDDFIPATPRDGSSYGFRFLANLTPRIDGGEIDRLRRYFKDQIEHDADEEDELDIREGAIRDTGVMAAFDATGIKRFGILRMDVDNLGVLFRFRLKQNDLMHASALSGFLGLFFEGWLNRLCQREADEWKNKVRDATIPPRKNGAELGEREYRNKTPYVLYAGGDDLFMVGTWDVLPHLAWCIRRDFGTWAVTGRVDRTTTELPRLSPTLSAGIYADARKFPIYRAAELAHEALDSAKHRVLIEKADTEARLVKDGVTWLDMTLGWQDFRHAFDLALELANLVNVGEKAFEGGEEKRLTVRNSFLWFLRSIAAQYRKDAAKTYTPGRVVYGRWMWLLAYGHKRRIEDLKKKSETLAKRVNQVFGKTRDLDRKINAAEWRTIEYLDLPVRWAELLIRGEETNNGGIQGK